MKERESLTFRLRSATEKDIKYTVRAQSLCKEEKQSEYQLFTQRKSVILNTSRPESLARSRNYSLQFQTQPKHSRKSFEKLPVSTAMRTSNSKNQTTKLYWFLKSWWQLIALNYHNLATLSLVHPHGSRIPVLLFGRWNLLLGRWSLYFLPLRHLGLPLNSSQNIWTSNFMEIPCWGLWSYFVFKLMI